MIARWRQDGLVGFHVRKAVENGTRHGIRIADFTVDRTLLPVKVRT